MKVKIATGRKLNEGKKIEREKLQLKPIMVGYAIAGVAVP